eukprot:346346-Chlamydomonas_euryale.AAC.2
MFLTTATTAATAGHSFITPSCCCTPQNRSTSPTSRANHPRPSPAPRHAAAAAAAAASTARRLRFAACRLPTGCC